jgi:hypothetical protein
MSLVRTHFWLLVARGTCGGGGSGSGHARSY